MCSAAGDSQEVGFQAEAGRGGQLGGAESKFCFVLKILLGRPFSQRLSEDQELFHPCAKLLSASYTGQKETGPCSEV